MTNYQKHKLKEVIHISHIVNIIYYKFSKNYLYEGESHDFWEFVYIDKGELIITAGNVQYLLKAGELAFHKPNEFHSLRGNGTTAANVIVASFVCNSPCMHFFEHKILFLDDFEKQCLSLAISESEKVYKPMEITPPVIHMQRQKDAPFGGEQLIKSSLEHMLIHIFRRQDSIHIRQRTITSNQKRSYHQVTKDIKEFLEAHLFEKITLEFISSELKISVSQLKKIFKKETGQSIMSYFTQLKIDEAKRLIHESTLNFTQIAEKLGYENIYYFSRVFKEKTGMTLTEYALSIKR
jgi:AraC-like DNA-binding protein